MRYPPELRERIHATLAANPGVHIVFPSTAYQQGKVRVRRDRYQQELLHRQLYRELVNPDLEPTMFLLRDPAKCENTGCENPHHYVESPTPHPPAPRKPRPAPKGTPDAAALNRVKTHCPHGHRYTPENTYVLTDKKGRTYRQCRTCTIDRVRAARARQ